MATGGFYRFRRVIAHTEDRATSSWGVRRMGFKVGDIVKAEGMLGTYEITDFWFHNTALLKPLQHIVDNETRYQKDIEKLTLVVK